jgi:anaerobic magnesium-protoporphyrin IX monomethyl ester cyclase
LNIILLNPPGQKIYVRNYYCPSTSKASYLFQPLDLMMVSGRLAEDHEVSVIDAIASRMSPDECFEKVMSHDPDGMVILTGSVSWTEDQPFIKRVKQAKPKIKIAVSGDLFFGDAQKLLKEEPAIDGAIFDFTSEGIKHFFKNDKEKICDMAFRNNGDVIVRKRPTKGGGVFTMPSPRHDLFRHKNYRFPFVKRYPYTTVMTNFGCPYMCNFCIASAMDFRFRPHAEVLAELRNITQLGIREIFFEDFTFGLPKPESRKLVQAMIDEKLDLTWTCYTRVDTVDEAFLKQMKQAGCHTIIFGVESADDGIVATTHKGTNKEQVKKMFQTARALKIRTVATFVLGLPEETRETCLETIAFAKELNPDYASFNVAVPRAGTELSDQADSAGLHSKDQPAFDHSGEMIAMPTKSMSQKEVATLREKAILEFYMRPGYIARQLMNISTWTEFMEHVSEATAIIKKLITNRLRVIAKIPAPVIARNEATKQSQ